MQNAPEDASQRPVLTSEQLEPLIRLESIFMPHARRQRNEVYKVQNAGRPESGEPIRFAHYTSADAALKIITSKRIWMRNTTCMSDYREVAHGFHILRTFFSDKPKLDAFVGALDACVPGAAMEAINLFNQWCVEGSMSRIQLNTYIASISVHQKEEDHHGRLSMWRAFGGYAARVAIVLAVPWYSGGAQALNIIFSPVAYLTEPQVHEVIYEAISNITKHCEFLCSVDRRAVVGTVFNMLLAGVTCLKHEGFHEELEWRVIYTPKINPSPLIEIATEVVAGVPQPIHKLPLDVRVSDALSELDLASMFDRLIIGPTQYPWAMYEAFVAVLRHVGVADAESRVFVSNIPIRS